MKTDKKKRRRAKNRETKHILVFDESERKQYLTGFHKRKEARKQKARELTEKMIKLERKELKQTKKEFLEKKLKHQYVPEDLEELDKELGRTEVKELPHHTVTITDISEVDLAGQGGLRLGKNQFQTAEEEKSDAESETPEPDISLRKKQTIVRKMEEKINKRTKHLKLGQASKKKFRKTKKKLSKKQKHQRKRLG